WMDANGKLVFGEARPDNGAVGAAFAGKISPGTARQLVTEYKDFKVLPIDLSRYGPGARDAFVNAVSEALKGLYSLHKTLGNVCSSVISIGFEAARNAQKGWLAVKLQEFNEGVKTHFWKIFGPLVAFISDLHTYTPKDAYLEAFRHSVPGYRFD